MKKLSCLLLLATLLVVGFGEPSRAATKVLRLGTDQVHDFFTTVALRQFAEAVEKETGGSVKIDVYDGGQLGQEKACIEQVQFGALDMAKTSLSPLSEFVPGMTVMNLPYLFRDLEHMWKVLEGEIGDELLETTKEAQMIALCWLDSGSRNFYAKKPLRDLPDFKGLKIRVPESQMMMAMIDALGAHATPMPANDIYSALQTGVCDAAENTIPRYLDMSHQEIAKFLTIDRHNIVPETVLISIRAWESLTPDEQKTLVKCAKDLQKNTQKLVKAEEERTIDTVTSKFGCTVINIDADVVARLRQACQPVYDQHGKPYAEMVKRMEAVK